LVAIITIQTFITILAIIQLGTIQAGEATMHPPTITAFLCFMVSKNKITILGIIGVVGIVAVLVAFIGQVRSWYPCNQFLELGKKWLVRINSQTEI
jgi:hypothetical protein